MDKVEMKLPSNAGAPAPYPQDVAYRIEPQHTFNSVIFELSRLAILVLIVIVVLTSVGTLFWFAKKCGQSTSPRVRIFGILLLGVGIITIFCLILVLYALFLSNSIYL